MAGSVRSTSSMTSVQTFSDESLLVLRARGTGNVVRDGFRAVSNRSYSSADSFEMESTLYVPETIERTATLQYLEFTKATAILVWAAYEADLERRPDRASMVSQLKRHVKSFPNPMEKEQDWIGPMQAMGLNDRTQQRLMNPLFEEDRLQSSLHETVLDIIDLRYDFLLGLDRRIKLPRARTIHIYGGRIHQVPDETHTVVPTERGSSRNATTSTAQVTPTTPSNANRRPNADVTMTSGYDASALFTEPAFRHSAVDSDRVVLYKGSSLECLDRICQEDGSLYFAGISSAAGTDFARDQKGIYFTPQRNVAWRYVEWTREKVQPLEIPCGILRIAIPKALLAKSKIIAKNIWALYVWSCRLNKPYPQMDFDFEDYDWLIGPICPKSTIQLGRIKGPEDLQVMKVTEPYNGPLTTATQYCVMQRALWDLLNVRCQGQTWIEDHMRTGRNSHQKCNH